MGVLAGLGAWFAKLIDGLASAQVGSYDIAAVAMLNSKWAHQTPNRAQRLARQMASGIHQSLPA